MATMGAMEGRSTRQVAASPPLALFCHDHLNVVSTLSRLLDLPRTCSMLHVRPCSAMQPNDAKTTRQQHPIAQRPSHLENLGYDRPTKFTSSQRGAACRYDPHMRRPMWC